MKKILLFYYVINAAIIIFIMMYMFLAPAAMMIYNLHDPGLYSDQIPAFVYKWHKSLSPEYEEWARDRVASGAASKLITNDVSGTEWPIFGSVFYLWATESLQDAYQENPSPKAQAPNEYARGAIEAAAALIADPNHAKWVIDYWGQDYLEKENLFYRMLLISGLTSYQKLTGRSKYEQLLRSQVESLATELDESPYGLLDDYPGSCFPVDIVPAIAAIQRADAVLGTDHSEFVQSAVRGFQDLALDEDTGLPGYMVNSSTGRAEDVARGVGLSFMLIWACELWPDVAEQWYQKYETQFWQQDKWLAGFREFSRNIDKGWFTFDDVDAGPLIKGNGAAACAFGIGASRAMGRFDHAYALGGEAVVGVWSLPSGSLLVPRLLSNFSDAPYLGEAAVLFTFSRRAVLPVENTESGKLPGVVYLGIIWLIIFGVVEIAATLFKTSRLIKRSNRYYVPVVGVQVCLWPLVIIAAVISWIFINVYLGFVILLIAQIIPVTLRNKTKKKYKPDKT